MAGKAAEIVRRAPEPLHVLLLLFWPSIRNQSVRSRYRERISSSKGCAASERTSCGEMLRLLQISSRVSSRIAVRCASRAWMVAFATPISLEKSSWDLLPRSIRRSFNNFLKAPQEAPPFDKHNKKHWLYVPDCPIFPAIGAATWSCGTRKSQRQGCKPYRNRTYTIKSGEIS